MVLIRPRERVILNAVSNERALKKRAKHMHKRFRSWSQQRIRQYWLPLNVSLTADPSMMDGPYLASCVQKAAGLRKHDTKLWRGYSTRLLEIADTLTPLQIGYVFYGYGKSYFLDERLYRGLIPYVLQSIQKFHSHALMCVIWALDRVHIKDDLLCQKIEETLISKGDSFRSIDLIKICNCLARMGRVYTSNNHQISKILLAKLEGTFAQPFRNVMCDTAIVRYYSDELKGYILSRFTRIFICCRPQHYQQAFQTAVALRVLSPNVWYSLSKQVRSFYIRLSMRRIPQMTRYPSSFQWDVSNCLAKLGIAHRNTFQWGCYWIDIGETEERKNCWFVDGPPSFYFNSNEPSAVKALHHRVLQDLGWNIKRVNWYDWVEFGDNSEEKVQYLRSL